MSAFGPNGCTILAWANPSSPLLDIETPIDADQRQAETVRELLTDAITLWGCRWGLDFTWHVQDNITYVYAVSSRITISVNTLERALGDLAMHVNFHRGGPHDSWEQLVRYRHCMQKWRVPDTVTESSSGPDQQEKASAQFWGGKKTRR